MSALVYDVDANNAVPSLSGVRSGRIDDVALRDPADAGSNASPRTSTGSGQHALSTSAVRRSITPCYCVRAGKGTRKSGQRAVRYPAAGLPCRRSALPQVCLAALRRVGAGWRSVLAGLATEPGTPRGSRARWCKAISAGSIGRCASVPDRSRAARVRPSRTRNRHERTRLLTVHDRPAPRRDQPPDGPR